MFLHIVIPIIYTKNRKIYYMKDLTKGNPFKTLILFMMPILLSYLFSQIYNLCDLAIVSNTIGIDALAGITSSGWLYGLIINLSFGLIVGFSVCTAQKFGAHDDAGVKKSFSQGIMLAGIIGTAITILACSLAHPLLRMLRTKELFYDYAYEYIIVIFAGILITTFNYLFINTLRAIGDSKMPLIFLLISVVVNVGFDYLFILTFKMGVAGAAIGTILSQLVSLIISAIYTFVKYPVFRLKLKDFKPDKEIIKAELYIGIPMAFQSSLIMIGLLFVQGSLNNLPEIYVQAFGISSKVDNLLSTVLNALGTALAIFVGQNYGARDYSKIKAGIKSAIIMSVIVSIVTGLLLIFASKPLVRLFLPETMETKEMMKIINQYFIMIGCTYNFLGLILVYRNALQGINKSMYVMIGGAIELVTRFVMAMLADSFLNYTGIVASLFVCWIFTGIFLAGAWYRNTKSLEKHLLFHDVVHQGLELQ